MRAGRRAQARARCGARLQQPPQHARRRGGPRPARGAGQRAARRRRARGPSRIGMALRWTGPSRHCHHAMCMPARECIHVSSAAKATSELPPSRTASEAEARQREARRRARSELERVPLADAERRQPEHAERQRGGQRQRDERDHREARAAELAGQRRRRGRVRQRAAAQNDEHAARGAVPRSARALHRTCRVNGAVTRRPPLDDLEEEPPPCRWRAAARRAPVARASCCGPSWRRPEACGAGRVVAADVRVEVVERAVAEEDRVRERAVEGLELHGLARGVGDVDDHRRGLGEAQAGLLDDAEREPAGVHDRRVRRQRRLGVAAPTCRSCVSWKLRGPPSPAAG